MAAQQHDTQLADCFGWFSIGLGVAEVAAPSSLARLIGVPDDSRSRAIVRAYGVREIATGVGLLSSRPHPGWFWARVAGDVLDLATLGLAMRRTTDRTRLSSAAASIAGVMVADVAAARRLAGGPTRSADQTNLVWKAFTINRSPEEVAARWNEIDPLGDIVTSVRFDAAPGDQGTEVRVAFTPGWFGRSTAGNVQEKLRQFKQLLETGEVARSTAKRGFLKGEDAFAGSEDEYAGMGGRR